MSFPRVGESWPVLKARMNALRAQDVDWKKGRSSLHFYYPGEEALDVAREAYGMFMCENALASSAFPSLKIMQDELIAAALDLFNAPPGAAGSVTTGGTESIILVVKAARDLALTRDPQRFRCGEILLPETAHPAFEKAADLLGLEVVRTRIGAQFRADPAALEAAISDRTIMIVASAPSLPFGLVDPVAELAEIARRHDIWLHVDACIGGYLAPFARQLGFPVPRFDFSIEGVRSISADLHKFGYSAKGASTLLYRTVAEMAFQTFTFSAWPKGRYYTPTLMGTRSGGAIASAWAVMHYIGRDGYLDITRSVMELRDRYVSGIRAIDGLELIVPPDLSILAYRSQLDNVAAIGARLARRGWYVSQIAAPPGLQQTINLVHERAIDDYLTDLAAAVAEVRSQSIVHENFEVVTY